MENVMIMDDYFDESKKHLATSEDSLQAREMKDKLLTAGIGIGSRFKIERMCSFNDMEVKSIDYSQGTMTFFHPTTHPDYQGEFVWPIDRVLDNIKLYQGSRWIQIDKDRKEIVVPQAKAALMERVRNPSREAAFNNKQVKALDRYAMLFPERSSKESIYKELFDGMDREFHRPDSWINDARKELIDLSNGVRREASQGKGLKMV